MFSSELAKFCQFAMVLILFVVILALLFVLQPYVLPQPDIRLDFPTTNIFIFNVVFTLILLLLLTPIHIWDYLKEKPAIGSKKVALVRIPFQFLLIYGAYLIYLNT